MNTINFRSGENAHEVRYKVYLVVKKKKIEHYALYPEKYKTVKEMAFI